ncbi:hypothetical protein [Streptacidiphilus cavernicola]|uniref:Uncharacterized protein n=1 Tax=Streptacidiphilus cavernicola TaxID=3342716 RepID=A0ABV6VNS8_9ACTN
MTTPRRRNKRAAATAVALMVCGLSVLGTTSASADISKTVKMVGGDGINTARMLQLYYNSNCAGAEADFTDDVPDYAGWVTLTGSGTQQTETNYVYVFGGLKGANGYGVAVKNNAASMRTDTGYYHVYYNSGYSGHSQIIMGDLHDACVNLDSTLKNNNASQLSG